MNMMKVMAEMDTKMTMVVMKRETRMMELFSCILDGTDCYCVFKCVMLDYV